MNERGLGVPVKRTYNMGRPKSLEPMISKTYSFYAKDIQHMLDKDYPPKLVLRKGLELLNASPEFNNRINDNEKGLEDINVRLERLVRTLTLMSKEHYAMREKLTALGIKFEEVVKNVD